MCHTATTQMKAAPARNNRWGARSALKGAVDLALIPPSSTGVCQVISDLYRNDLDRHCFAPAARAADEGRLARRLESLCVVFQTWVVIAATWWGWR